MATINQIISWWDSQLVPTIAQRVATFSSFWHKDDTIAISDIDGLDNALAQKVDVDSIVANKVILAAGTTYYDMPSNSLLLHVWCMSSGTPAAVGVGYANNSNAIFDAGELPANGNLVMSGVVPFKNATRIYFNGVASDTVTIIFKL